LPLGTKIGTEVGDDTANLRWDFLGRAGDDPFRLSRRQQAVCSSEREEKQARPLDPRLDEADEAEPGYGKQETGDELEARIVETGEEEQEDRQSVRGGKGGQDGRDGADAGVSGDTAEEIGAEEHRQERADQRVLAAFIGLGADVESAAQEYRQDHGQQR